MSLISMLAGPVAKTARSAEPATAADGEKALAFADAVDDARAALTDSATPDAVTSDAATPEYATPDAAAPDTAIAVAPALAAAPPVAQRVEASSAKGFGSLTLAQPVSSPAASQPPLDDPQQASGTLSEQASHPGTLSEQASQSGTLSERSETKRVERASASRNETSEPAPEGRLRLAPLAQPVSSASTPPPPLNDAQRTPGTVGEQTPQIGTSSEQTPQLGTLSERSETKRVERASASRNETPTPVELPQSLRPAPASAAPTTASAMPAAMVRPSLLPQVSAPVLALTQAADGDHQLTLTISPESLGPVTVRAHISGGTMRIELAAPTDLGRDALRMILADLRRDLAAAAPHATLAISAQDGAHSGSSQSGSGHSGAGQPSAAFTAANGHGSSQSSGSQSGTQNGGSPADRGQTRTSSPDTPQPTPTPLTTPHGGIDVYA
ncbi:flagellar hook-length control protein FliK [Microbacterium sp.]|uniref:flagellar hook-length control protein FliK n=1 Tax=Microbacterium sp. TaxID=51671 RepID=UPI002C0F425B|nr:flagellar hook-length control protein FliK [Microbacterium sp.]HWK76595.1 flagellar hook-length control protein FliK [Microbacterium sp.]